MCEYRYAQLPPASIRLLQLLPSKMNPQTLRCELFEYHLQDSNRSFRPYEALSYVWGSEEKPKTIIIDGQSLCITQNLYTALVHLQDSGCSRTIWVDAICINQTDEKEKERQIPLMVEIYSKASRVIVWLGEAEHDSDQALDAICLAG
jgi:hypothetical protein